MTNKEMQRILLYHNKHGFEKDLKDMYARMADIRDSNSEMSSFSLSLAVPSNRNNASTVEIYVMKNATLLELEVQAREMERFIGRLNDAIETLPEKERHVIRARYFNKQYCALDFIYVAQEVNYGMEWCEKLNKRALEILVRELHGVQVTWGEND